MNEIVPEGWNNITIGEATLEIEDGGTPTTSNPEYFGGSIPWVVIDDIQPRIIDTKLSITDLGLQKSSAKLWDKGTIILSTGATIGKVGIAMKAMATKQGICGVVPKHDVSREYFYQLLISKKRQLNILSQGSTIREIRPPSIKKIQICIPPLPEQKKIASILTSVDEVIEKTQLQIDKLQDVKKGIMNELLTKGIGHTEFKNSVLGRIPKNWKVMNLIDLSINGISNGVFNDPKKVGSGYKLINVYDMYQKFGFKDNELKRLSLDEDEFKKNKVIYGDIFFTRSSLTIEGIGYCNVCLSHSNNITYDGHLMRIRPNQDIVDPIFLAYFGISNIARTFLMRMSKQSTMTTIGQEDIAQLPVLIPLIEEQQKIVSIVSRINEQITKIEKKVTKLQLLKKSLMQDLLIGKIRVSIN